MAKDYIIDFKPKDIPPASAPTNSTPQRRHFLTRPKSRKFKITEINIEDYDQLAEGDLLEEGDIYFNVQEEVWEETIREGCQVRGKDIVYFRKSVILDPDIDIANFVRLSPDDNIQEGDEFYYPKTKEWLKANAIDFPCGEIFVHRRPRESLFTESELEAARQYYGIEN